MFLFFRWCQTKSFYLLRLWLSEFHTKTSVISNRSFLRKPLKLNLLRIKVAQNKIKRFLFISYKCQKWNCNPFIWFEQKALKNRTFGFRDSSHRIEKNSKYLNHVKFSFSIIESSEEVNEISSHSDTQKRMNFWCERRENWLQGSNQSSDSFTSLQRFSTFFHILSTFSSFAKSFVEIVCDIFSQSLMLW